MHRDAFVWTYADMIRIDPRVLIHKLSVDPSAKLV